MNFSIELLLNFYKNLKNHKFSILFMNIIIYIYLAFIYHYLKFFNVKFIILSKLILIYLNEFI